MRTKTMLLSALLGALGSVSVHAQNVYSLNTVGYINITVAPGFNIISCPLIGSPDPISGTLNTIGTLLPNGSNQLAQCSVWAYDPAVAGGYTNDTASTKGNPNTNGWKGGGQITMLPGQGVWFDNAFSSNLTFTFVGQVSTGSNMPNPLYPGFNLVSSILPMSGDLVTNTLSALGTNAAVLTYGGVTYTNPVFTPTSQDTIWVYSPSITNYLTYTYTSKSKAWGPSDPLVPFVGAGFWYQSQGAVGTSNIWLETYNPSVSNYISLTNDL
jgi:hypothetical protein